MIEIHTLEKTGSPLPSLRENASTRAIRVLVVDDNPDDRALVLRALRREFPLLEPLEVKDEASITQALQAPAFHLIVADYQLNWSTGLDLLTRFREHSPRCPVIMYTGSGNEEVAVQAMKSGVDDYVLKSPRHLAQLSASARALVEREANLKRAEISEARLERLLSRINIAVFRSTRVGELLSANDAFLRILGFASLEEAKDRKWNAWSQGADGSITGIGLSPEPGKGRITETRLKHADGADIWVSLWAGISPEDDDVLEALFADISERKQAEQARLQMDDAARQNEKLEALGRLAGGVAHDFNNLLTAINGYSELLIDAIGETSAMREDLLEIQKAGTRAARITRELLAFGRRQMLNNKSVDMNSILLSLKDPILRSLGDSIGHELKLEENLRSIKADPVQIEIMIINLILNARDALHPGGRVILETANVDMGEERPAQSFQQSFTGPPETIPPGPYVSLSVADTGIGMDQATLARVFEPFFTTKPVNKGTGLGLSTVYGIVKQSKGHIFVESAPGKGSTFRILLPAAPSEEDMNALLI